MIAVIKHGNSLVGRNHDGKVTPSDSADISEAHLRHTASLRSAHSSERGRHERARRLTRTPGAAVGQTHPDTPLSHRHRLR
jgi:hypothetical protein